MDLKSSIIVLHFSFFINYYIVISLFIFYFFTLSIHFMVCLLRDWYNLEKSKRVKAFRCGEFDDCIERAEASLGMPTRKREKYARREDAILHALELEKELLKKQGKLGVISDHVSNSSGSVKKESVTSSGALEISTGNPGNISSNQFSERPEISLKDKNVGSPLNLQKAKDRDQPSFEDEHSEVIPRMRGLKDLELRTAPPKRKLSSPSASDGSGKLTVDNNCQTPSSSAPGMGRTSPANGKILYKNGKCF